MQVIGNFLTKYRIKENKIAIGVSGGADSLALALMFKEEFPGYSLVALTVDHGLRPSSHDEALYVAKVMDEHHIEHHILTWEGDKPATGIEEAARVARYDLLCDWCKVHDFSYLAIAHHLCDQSETFFMRLERGSGLYGLSSIQDISLINGVTVIRPFLEINPDVLKKYLRDMHIDWVEDESNQCTDFLRVRMRQFLPMFVESTGITLERINSAVRNLQHIREFIDNYVAEIIKNKVHFWDNCGCSFDYCEFLSWHDEIKFYVIGKLIQKFSIQTYQPEASALKELIKQINKEDFNGATLGGIYFYISDLRLWLIKEHRDDAIYVSDVDWESYVKEKPEVRGIKIPHKLKQALFYEKNYKK